MILPTKNVDGKGKFRKKLMDEVEHDIMNYQNRGLSHLPKQKAEANNTDTRFDNSGYHAKIEFNKCFIITFFKQSQKRTLLSEFAKI